MRDVDVTIAQSEFARRELVRSGIRIEQTAVKPNSVDLEPPLERPAQQDVSFLFAGRLVEEKGVRTLLEAWRKASWPLWIAGEGPLSSEVASASSEFPWVNYLGHISRPALVARMRHASALIFPSIWFESSPMLIIEALAAGLPVIASRIGAISEMVQDGATGFLYEPGDSNDLLRCVHRLAEDAELRKTMSACAREVYEVKYTGQTNVQRLEEIYRQAIRHMQWTTAASESRCSS
jgi:glycosyltransferase involved in cell wall biosynthesis